MAVTTQRFHNKNEFVRREFIVDSIYNAISLVRGRVQPKKLDIDFEELLADFQFVEQEYLKHKTVISSS